MKHSATAQCSVVGRSIQSEDSEQDKNYLEDQHPRNDSYEERRESLRRCTFIRVDTHSIVQVHEQAYERDTGDGERYEANFPLFLAGQLEDDGQDDPEEGENEEGEPVS